MRKQTARATFILGVVLLVVTLVPAWSRAAQIPDAASATIIIPAAADTYVTNIAPDANYGNFSYLNFSYNSLRILTGSFLLFRFDVQEALGPEAIIDSATLELYQIGASGAPTVTAQLHPILEPWTETGVTFNNQPAVYTGPFLLATTLDNTVGWKQIDLTQFADNWLAGDGYGVELRSTTDDFARTFESTEHNERMPRLVIQYHLPATVTPSPPPTASQTPAKSPTPTKTPTPTFTPTPFPQTLELCAVADATVNEADPGSNYGAEQLLQVGYGQGQNEPFARRALLRFDLDLIPPGAEILEAHFEAGQVLADGLNLVQLPLYAVREAWDETAVTWNNQPPVSPAPAAITAVDDGVPTIISWEVRELVREWLTGGLENNGLELRGPEGGVHWLRGYDSRHSTPFCPRLVLKLLAPAPIPTPTPPPTATPTATPTAVCPSPDAAGNSFAAAAPLTLNQETAELLCPSGDFDYWKFPIEAGQEIKLYLWGMVGDYDLALLDPNGALVKESALWGAGQNEYIYHLSYQNGDFRAVVNGKGVADWHPTKPYKIKVDAPFKCFDPDEAGNDFASAKEILPSLPGGNIQRPLHGTICPEGDIDFYKFYVPKGQDVTIRADLTELPADFDLMLRDPSGNLVDYSSNDGKTADWVEHITSSLPGWWRVSVFGPKRADGTYPYHSAPYKLDVKLTSPADLSVRGIEITQAIQDMNNSVNLVAGKLTVARVYIDGGGVPGPLSGVEVKLRAYQMVWGVPKLLPGELLKTANNLILRDLHGSRLDTAASVNFFLPKEWTGVHSLRLRADVNPTQNLPETDFSNNAAVADVIFQAVQTLNLGLVPVQVGSLVPNPQTDADVIDMVAWTRQAFPTHEIKLWYRSAGAIMGNHNYTFPGDGTCGPGWSNLLDDLADTYDDWSGRPGNAVVFGVMARGVTPAGPVGCGRLDQGVSAGIMGPNPGPLLAHEMGHNYARKHAPCAVPDPDPKYPTYLDPQGTAYFSGSIGEVGLNPSSGAIFDPLISADLMSYCPDEWISPYTWEGILNRMPAPLMQSMETQTAAPHIVISGSVREGIASFDPFWIQDRPANNAADPGTGPFSLRLLDAAGKVLGERRLEIQEEPIIQNHDIGHFREWLRYPPETAAIALYKDGRLLLQRQVSPHAPQVTLLAPNGGEQWPGSGPYTVRWQATDADGDPLTAKVLYSPDNGQTWQVLAVNLDGREVTLDTPYLPGGAKALVRLVVTDGVNTTTDQSDAPFQVNDKPPLLFLLNPPVGASYTVGEAVVLQAAATDPEDGPLPEDSLHWSLPGMARASATGSDVVLDDLLAGTYTFTVTARDAQGHATTRETKIIVGWSQLLPIVTGG